MNLAEAEKLGLLQARNHAQDAGLLAELQMVLKADQVEAIGAQIFLAELHSGLGAAAGARIDQSHGLHGAEAQRVAAAAGQFLDRQAGFEVRRGFIGEICRRRDMWEETVWAASSASTKASYCGRSRGQLR